VTIYAILQCVMFPRDDQIKWQDEDAEDIPAFPEPGFAQESVVGPPYCRAVPRYITVIAPDPVFIGC
jgi:hypothetical protein